MPADARFEKMQHTFNTLVSGETTQEEFDSLTWQLYYIAEQCGASLKNGIGVFIKMDIIAKVKQARAKLNNAPQSNRQLHGLV